MLYYFMLPILPLFFTVKYNRPTIAYRFIQYTLTNIMKYNTMLIIANISNIHTFLLFHITFTKYRQL